MAEKIEELLLEKGFLTQEQRESLFQLHERTGKKIEDCLIDGGFVDEETVVEHLSQIYRLPFEPLVDRALSPEVVTLLSEDFCRKGLVIPVRKEGNVLYLATRDPFNFVILDEAQNLTNLVVKPLFTSRSAILKKLHEYREHFVVQEVTEFLKGRSLQDFDLRIDATVDEREGAEQAPIVNLVSILLLEGLRSRASDIHIQPGEDGVKIRFRVDGLLRDVRTFGGNVYPPLLSRIKIMAGLDIAEKRLPQDGQFTFSLKKRKIDVRVSTLPTVAGEKAVLRLLDKTSMALGLEFLGFPKQLVQKLRRVVHKPHGILIVTGPTGAGKTTTLYSLLQTINTPDKNITTVENPVEYHLNGIAQVQVVPKIGLNFAQALRSILRQDPDIVLIGEIRDPETAEIAIRAALTGHLVLATLHTNDAASCVARLLDMGAEPYLLASSLRGVLSQRLVRTICPQCKVEVAVSDEMRRRYKLTCEKIAEGKGCAHCFYTGYQGRECLGEYLSVSLGVQELIVRKVPARTIFQQARAEGMQTLLEAGFAKVEARRTTLKEVLRATEGEEGEQSE